MRVRVRLFAGTRDAVGAGAVDVDVHEGARVDDVVAVLCEAHPRLVVYRPHVLHALDGRFVTPATLVQAGSELALMPPVSGGAGSLQEGPFSLDALASEIERAGAGATVIFVGHVRGDGGTQRLRFEAYAEMAEREIEAVRREAIAKFSLTDCVVRHRIATLAVGEPIVAVATAATHRREAFEAAQWIMDELKTRVPIWKAEESASGARWVNDPVGGPGGKAPRRDPRAEPLARSRALPPERSEGGVGSWDGSQRGALGGPREGRSADPPEARDGVDDIMGEKDFFEGRSLARSKSERLSRIARPSPATDSAVPTPARSPPEAEGKMADVTAKPIVHREAVAEGFLRLKPETLRSMTEGTLPKGDPFGPARIAGIMAAKNTPQIVPLCHPIPLTSIEVELVREERGVRCKATVVAQWKTGVEMEALTAVAGALLTVWDMTKALEKDETGNYPDTAIEAVRVLRKTKGAP